jgi:phage terminase large subunit
MPAVQIPEKIWRAYESKAMYKIIYGGRGSAKSGSVGRLMLKDCQTKDMDVLCGREFQNSIDDSVHKLLSNLINDPEYGMWGFDITDKRIVCTTNQKRFSFKGWARNPNNIKSAEDFLRCWAEEAEKTSQETIDKLLPTIRNRGSQIYFTMNPESSSDPISLRFIQPFLDEISKNGYHEDDMHYIVKVNWRDNPFWTPELEKKRVYDFENMTRAKYDWIWEGEFNDSVEDALIQPEWFDACVNAHKRLGFEPIGVKIAAHDPSDVGPDSKGFGVRHGAVIIDLKERLTGGVNEGAHWATGLALNHGVDYFTWDCDGLGIGLNEHVSQAFEGKGVSIVQFKGSEAVENPEAMCNNVLHAQFQNPKTNKESLRNKRAQNYLRLRNRIYRTYQAVELNVYHNPDKLISFSPEIDCIKMLRSELCKMPIKPNRNGQFEMYTKDEMKSKFKFMSPNLADTIMMLMPNPVVYDAHKLVTPVPTKTMGIRPTGYNNYAIRH